MTDQHILSTLRAAAHPLTGSATDYDPLLDLVGDARFVLLGEATHGTHEFYAERARITRRLIEDKGFTAVAVEADWPDAYRVNRYVRGRGDDQHANAALSGFQRFPNWMWRNTDVEAFVEWLRGHNAARKPGACQVGCYGLDLYSMFTSIEEVLRYLDGVDPAAAHQARERYACFDQYAEDSEHYGYTARLDMSASCEEGVIAQLQQMQQRAADYMRNGGDEEAFFYAQQNARLVKNAEEYYRTMFRGRVSSWNRRDSHMAETLDALARHLSQDHAPAKIVVWEHNSHIGDARATEMGEMGEWTMGELARKRYDGQTRFFLPLRDDSAARDAMQEQRLERAIGVIYQPRTERNSHYFAARIASQFDAVIHIDRTTAVTPLDTGGGWHAEEPPETYPSGL